MSAAQRLVLACLVLIGENAHAHGGVVADGDLCLINVNYLSAHFKVYQPRIDGHKDYCEDLPNATESVFVMEYLHDGLGEMPLDFRIIRDVTGKGRFALWEDVAQIGDLDSVTVYYREPVIDPDVLTVVHEFDEEGDYIGIVTVNAGDGKTYRAVFPFEVGFTGIGYWPYFVVLALIIQAQFLFTSDRFAEWRRKRRQNRVNVALLLLTLMAPATWTNEALGTEPEQWLSEKGTFSVQYESSLEPIEINRIHSWSLHITANGEPVAGAAISVVGGMPAHDHGLPTRPRVTEDLGGGRYRLDGMRFHMQGEWELTIDIEVGGRTDTVVIKLHL